MPLRALPFREVKRKLEAAGFIEVSRKGSHINLLRRLRKELIRQSCLIIAKSLSAHSEVSYGRPESTRMCSRVYSLSRT